MAPLLSASSSRISALASPISHPASFLPPPSPFILSPALRADEVFAELGWDGSEQRSSALLESRDGEALAVASLGSSAEAAQARVPRCSRLQRYECELDECFAQFTLSEEEF